MTRVYAKRKMVESQEQQVGQDSVREITANNEMSPARSESVDGHHLAAGQIEVSSRNIKYDKDGRIISAPVRDEKWLAEMAFMNEMVTVRIHPSNDKNANPLPDVYVNGRVQRFVRGAEQQVRRCYVEVLARSKQTTFDNVKVKDPEGEDKYVYPSHTAEIFPFTVINDSAKGEQWLKKVLAQA